jgi:glycine cleavage system transcriptional repressor
MYPLPKRANLPMYNEVMPHFVVAAVGPDQPGIVAEFTRVFLEHECNLEDTSMAALRGQFAMMLVVEGPSGLSPNGLQEDLTASTSVFGLVVSVWPIDERMRDSPPGEPWTVSIYGADRPGIVHGITKLLAEQDVNIVDLTTRLVGEGDNAIYSMVLEVTVPPSTDAEQLQHDLERTASELGVECSMHASDAEIL